MRFSILATLALLGVAIAMPQQPEGGKGDEVKTIPVGAPCTKDGSMGICEGGFCLQDEKDSQGTCQTQN
ncbi:hypothetical protein BDV25DRAFT_152458 [Aspergillus avenaceus]|uniref:Uncharacterized protein n=1 Tax=Aspergillus avenaceus TaxID=36643 RepID=A0A5N6TZY9_ASPAV|nr:hypothetical protein BDV25DRAFT_152458 [Aspergillus avenaceus]